MTNDKVVTLMGFAIRAGKVIFGTDAIERYHRRKQLILVDKSLSLNSREKLVRDNKSVPIVLSTSVTLADLTHRDGVKAIALTDKQMAQAILNNMNGSYQLITEVK